jgi:hypothetical protein
LIDTQNLDEEFEKKLHLKTGKSPEKIKEAVVLIKKSLILLHKLLMKI